MTKKDIGKFIKNEILIDDKYSLIQKGIFVLNFPIKDILSGFCFEQSFYNKSEIYFWWFVQPLYAPEKIIHLTFGKRLLNNKSDSWNIINSKANVAELKITMGQNLSWINFLSEPVNFFDHYIKKEYAKENLRFYENLVYTLVWIMSPNAKKEIENCITYIEEKLDNSVVWISEIKENMVFLKSSSNPRKILEEWKHETVKSLEIEKNIL